VVYGVLGGLVWWEVDNVRTYREYRDNYKALVDGDSTTVAEPPYDGVDPGSLREARDDFRRYSELLGLVIGVAYLLNITDAFVDAHLKTFDVSEDLSLRLRPGAVPSGGGAFALGLGVRLEWSAARRMPVSP
jgi:hypothetical protein